MRTLNSEFPIPISTGRFIVIKGEVYDTGLNKLDLSRKNLTARDIMPLKHMENLEELDLSQNMINDISAIRNLPNLRVLYLNRNRIENITPLRGMNNLEVLWLHNNRIKNIAALGGLPRLYALLLHDNQIRDLLPLHGMPTLRILGLRNNPLRFAQINELKDTLKRCQIMHTAQNNPCVSCGRLSCVCCTRCVLRSSCRCIRGDVNGDGVVTIADALEILKYLAEIDNLISKSPNAFNAAARITASVIPTMGDALAILKYLAGMESQVTGKR